MLRAAYTEVLICEKLIEMMQKKSYMDIKVTELVKYANISRSAFYVHFDSIFGVIQKIEDDFIANIMDRTATTVLTSDNKVSDSTVAILQYIKENLNIYRALCGPHGDPSFQPRLSSSFSERFAAKLSKHANRKLPKAQVRLIYENISGGRWSMYKWWAFHEDEVTVEEMAELCSRINSQLLSLLD